MFILSLTMLRAVLLRRATEFNLAVAKLGLGGDVRHLYGTYFRKTLRSSDLPSLSKIL